MLISRRDALKAGALALAAPRIGILQAAPRKLPIGLQLYSVRADCAKDFDGTLAKVAEMGFEGVEFAGYHSYAGNAEGLRKKLDQLKLKAEGAHLGAGNFAPEKLKQTVAFHKTLGCKFLILPGDGRYTHPEKSKEYAKWITDLAAALKADGMYTGHHNHTKEFEKAPGEVDKTYFDLFAERTSKDVIIQQDCGWTVMAGLDPIAMMKKYPGRMRTTHIKPKLPKNSPAGKKALIGQDVTDWKAVVQACGDIGGTEWLVLEQEDYPDGMSPLEATKASLAGLKKLLG